MKAFLILAVIVALFVIAATALIDSASTHLQSVTIDPCAAVQVRGEEQGCR